MRVQEEEETRRTVFILFNPLISPIKAGVLLSVTSRLKSVATTTICCLLICEVLVVHWVQESIRSRK